MSMRKDVHVLLCGFLCSLGPPAGHKLAVVIDDVHLPEKEQYGAVPALEMLRLLMDRAGIYTR
jgi:dynein heavy chain